MDNIIIVVAIVAIVGLASFYVYKSKKRGKKCIGCPYADACGQKNCKKE